MAKLYRRPGSPFWWVRYASRGIEVRKSTGFRIDVTGDIRKAQALRAKLEAEQFNDDGGFRGHRWDIWVDPFLRAHYSTSPKSLSRALAAWHSLKAYLDFKRIPGPANLAYDHCFTYLPWRMQGNAKLGVYKIHHNTALLELKFLHMIMEHAVRSGYSTKNPVHRLGIAKIPPKEKPEIALEHMATIWAALEAEPEWMRTCFQVAFYTGCRLNETRLELHNDVDLENRTITFRKPKGGEKRAFTVPIRDELFVLFQRLKKEGRSHAFDFPRMPSKHWWMFFKKIGLSQYCFHCLRVTFITHACRSGLNEREVMLLVNHASTTIHRIYQRWRVADLRHPLQRIRLHPLEGGPPGGSSDAS